MTNSKENDWLLNRVSNPTFSISDFKAIGLNATNTSLEDASVYKNIQLIRDNPMFQTNGNFDESKFDNVYKYMAETYNLLADESYLEDVLSQAVFSEDNIFVDPKQRRKGPDIYLTREANPLRQKRGIRRLNLLDAPTLSADEAAQTQKVLANPVDVANGAKPIWHESPNDSFWTDFWDTRVMAQWDEDGEHIDPISGEKVKHVKGEYKLNENGTYYYENLNGRDVYGRKVLSKLNTLTTDGTAINKYDFFDSDGIDKSLVGSLTRNAVSIIPMLIPGISPWYIGTMIALETTKVLATLGKVFTGSDNKFLSSVEGFTKSLEPTTSEYGLNNAWSMENFVNLAGDVFKLLYEQRWIFKYAPALFKGGEVMNESTLAKKLKEFQSKYVNLDSYLKVQKSAKNESELAKYLEELRAVNMLKAQNDLENYVKSYNKVGEVLSKAYMTGITVQDAYGEAKALGATDLEAALLTLGYAAGEYAIINSKLGEWILPELRMDKEQMKLVVSTLSKGARKTIENGSKVQKAEWAKKIFKIGKDIAQANYSVGKSGLKATAANALGEGIEEVSEEVLYDFVKSVTNLGMWLAGSDTKPLQAWDNMLDRYGMSFVGGMMGGAMFDAVPNLRAARQLGQMNNEQAMQQLIYFARNGKMNDFLKIVDKMQLGNKYLSATKMTEGIDGKKIWSQGTDSDNQDLAAKSEIRRIAKFVMDTLSALGATISDESFLDTQTLNDLRFAALKNSTVAASYLLDYNSVCEKIVTLTNQINSLNGTQQRMQNGGPTDELLKNGENDTTKAERSKLEAELNQALERKEAYMKGDLAPLFIYEALFEMSTAVSNAYMAPTLIQYAENKTGKKITEIPKNELENISKEYEGWKNSGFKDAVKIAANIHKSIAKTIAPLFLAHSLKYYESINEELKTTLGTLQSSLNNYTKELNAQRDSEEFLLKASRVNTDPLPLIVTPLVASLGSDNEIQTLNNILNTPLTESYTDNEKYTQLATFLNNFLASHIEAIVNPIIKLGYINPEIKRSLLDTLSTAYWYFTELAEYYDDAEGLISATKIEQAKSKIQSLLHSNITELLDQFSLSATDSDVKISKLIEQANESLKTSDISDFSLSNNELDLIKEALSIINIFKALLLSARTDNADLSNLFGMNTTINELDHEANLAEISSNIADAMMQDLEMIESRLKTFQKIIETNTAQKLSEQTKTANNKNILIYNRIKQFILNIPDDWSGKAEFLGVISSLSKLEEISSAHKTSLDREEKKQVELEIIKLDDAIYDFFKANEDKVKDPEILSKIINPNNFNLVSVNDDIEVLNSESTSIDDNAIVWYLASRAAVKASDFYSEYRTIISDKIAPIPTQELATYLGYASILNGEVIENFCSAVNASLKKYAETLSDAEWKNLYGDIILKSHILDSLVSPRFSRVTFIEGIPGSGKTTGVFNNLILLLKKYHSEVLKNVWIVHATEDSAKGLAKDLNLELAVTLDREHYMEKISLEWKGFEEYPQKLSKEVDPDSAENTMISIVDEGDVYSDDNNIIRSNFKINEISEPPTLILIDEVSRHTVIDMDLTDRFSQKYGVPVITAGDFDLSIAVGRHLINYNGQNVKNTIQLARRNFIRCPKLGVSMRSNNSLVDINLKFLRSILSKLRTNNYDSEILLHYYLDESGLYGTKIYNSKQRNSPLPYSIELLKKDIDLMISTMKPKEKIGFMYYDTDSEIYKLLSSATYKDKIDFKLGNSSLGLEGRYYIIDDSSNLQNEDYWSDLYTGISRAVQGSIVIHNKSDEYKTPISNQLSSILDNSTSVSELPKEGIKAFSEERRKILEEIPLNGTPTKINSRKKDATVPTVTVVNNNGLSSEEVVTVTDDGTKEQVILTNNGLPTEDDIRLKTQISNEEVTAAPLPTTEVFNTSGTNVESVLNLLMYTFMTFETGTTFDDRGNLIVSLENEKRLDSYFGLNRLSKIPKSKESFDKIIGTLRSIIFNTSDKSELVKKIKTVLKLDGDVYCTFAFKSSSAMFNNKDWGRFKKLGYEKLSYLFSNDADSDKVKLKTLSIIIGNGDTDVLELPLAVFPNPITLFKNDKFKSIRDEYNEISRSNPDLSLNEKFKLLIDFIEKNPSIEGGSAIIDFLKVFNFNSNGIFYINDPSWTLAGNLKSQGPTITNRVKGYDYEYNSDLKFDGLWITLDELSKIPGRSVSKVKIAPKGIYTFNNKSVNFAKPGHPFVLISDDIMLNGPKLEEYYYKQLEDESIEKKVKLVYVVPPKVSVKDYFDNLLNIVSKNKSLIKRIGNDFTAYRILKILFSLPGFEKSELNYNNTAFEELRRLVDRIATSEDDTKAQMEILNSEVDIKGLNKGITAREALQNYLLSIVYPPDATSTSRVFKEAYLNSIEHILEQSKITGIFYNVQYDKNSQSSIMLDAMYDKDSYSIDRIPFMVNGKIESPSFYGDVSQILKFIVSKITKNGSFDGSKDNAKYLDGNSRIDLVVKPTTSSILKGFNIVASLTILSEPEFNADALANLSKDQVLELFRKTNHLVLPIGNTIYISKKSNNLDVTNASISNILKLSLNTHKFVLTLGNEVYNAEFDLFNNEATLIKESTASGGTQLTQFEVSSIKEVSMYKNILDIFTFISLNKVKNARGVDDFNTAVNSLRVTPKILSDMQAEINNFEGELQELLQKLVDFLQSKLDERTHLNTTDKSCPIQIKIKF